MQGRRQDFQKGGSALSIESPQRGFGGTSDEDTRDSEDKPKTWINNNSEGDNANTTSWPNHVQLYLQLATKLLHRNMPMCYNLLESGLLDSAWILFEKNFRMPPEVALLRFIYFVGVHM